MHVIVILPQTERNRLDRSVRCAEKRRCRTRMLQIRDPIRQAQGVCATADAGRGEKHLLDGPTHAIFALDGRPLGQCVPKAS